MKIVINAYQYAPAITGTDRMAWNFLDELQKLDTTNQYYVICSLEGYIPPIVTAPNFKIIRPRWVLPTAFGRRLTGKAWRTMLPAQVKRLKADVYFSFHNMRLPHKRVAGRMVASNLDLIPLVLDDYKNLSPGQKEEIEHTAAAADAFMAISQFSKDELCTLLKVAPEKVSVIHLAADERFYRPADKTVLDQRQLPAGFIFTLGGSEPRKNVRTVVEAFTKLPAAMQAAHPLVIAGGSWHGRPLTPLKVNENVHLLDYVSEAELPALYQQAAVFAFASSYEGFGFTILEAMASKTPVVSARSSSLVEVAGNAALMFDPVDSDALAAHLKKVLTDTGLRQKLIADGQQRAKEFSWEVSAQKLHKLLTGGSDV